MQIWLMGLQGPEVATKETKPFPPAPRHWHLPQRDPSTPLHVSLSERITAPRDDGPVTVISCSM